MATLTFARDDTNLFVTGKTFYVKEALKLVGGKWKDPRWVLPLSVDTPEFRAGLIEKAVNEREAERVTKRAERAFAISPEGIAKAKAEWQAFVIEALKKKALTGEYHYLCCEKVSRPEFRGGLPRTSCLIHGFCINGSRYVGD
jgi:hypothetical protein